MKLNLTKVLALPMLVLASAFGIVEAAIAGTGGIEGGVPGALAVPEPASLAVLAAGAAGLYLIKRTRR